MCASAVSSISKPITSPEDQSATFVELFFDLVFVYSVTQVVGLLHHAVQLDPVWGRLCWCGGPGVSSRGR